LKKLKTLIVAAYKEELKHFCSLGRKHFLVQDNVAYLSAGIGPVAATFGLTHFLEDYRPELIVSLGTTGATHSRLAIGDIVCAQVVSTDSGFHDVYSIKKTATLHHSTNSRGHKYTKKLKDINSVSVFCPQEISKTSERGEALAKAGFDVENLEAFAFAFVAKKFRIPLISLLGITNYVGPKAHLQWKKNEEKVCRKISKIVRQIIL